jgi:hypothetical protein
MDLQILKTELDDPQYAAMTDEEAADSLNDKTIDEEIEFIDANEVFEAIVLSDYVALSSDNKVLLQTILGMGVIKVKGANTRAALAAMFAATTTLTNLIALQDKKVSWADQNWTGRVKVGHVEMARAI